MAFDASNKTKNMAYMVLVEFWQMGMMKSYPAALKGLVDLCHQRSATSLEFLAYSEKLRFLISQDIFTLYSSVQGKQIFTLYKESR